MAAKAGKDVKVRIDLNDVGKAGTPSWSTIAQQRGGSQGGSSETADATHKDLAGWPSAVVTRTPWSISVDGALLVTDPAYLHLVATWKARIQTFVQVVWTAIGMANDEEGPVLITSLNRDFPESDIVQFSIELQGNGALVNS